MSMKKACRCIMICALLLCTLSGAVADTYHTFCDLRYGMPPDEFEQWLESNTTNGRDPIPYEHEFSTSYGTYGEVYIDLFHTTGLLAEAVFVHGIGLSRILLTVEDANYHPLGDYPEKNEKAGITRAVNGYLKIVDALVEAYGPWDVGTYQNTQDGEPINLPYPDNREALRAALEASNGMRIKLRFDNVTISYGTFAEDRVTQLPYANAISNIVYWGPELIDQIE